MSWRTDRQKSKGDAGRYSDSTPPHPDHQRPIMTMARESAPSLSATFYPGGDDYYYPELVSPLPQRVMPEVPSNMQDGLAHLELEAKGKDGKRISSQSTVSSISPYSDQFPGQSSTPAHTSQQPRGYTASYDHTNAQAYQDAYNNTIAIEEKHSNTKTAHIIPHGKDSAFPRLIDAGPNVPPSDDEKEEVLERARSIVLNSNDPEMQLAWAQDALLWVETAVGHRLRETAGVDRSPTPTVEHQLRVDAISIVCFLADQHHPKAVFMKGVWHEFAKFGYPLDKFESIRLYRIAAEKGYARAEYRIGTQYEALSDMHRAIKHYLRGMAMGDSASNYRMGMMTLLGQHGEQQNYQKGIEQIRFAANAADENAPQGAYVYGMLLSRELPNITIPDMYMSVDIDQAKQYIEKAAYLGFAKAQQKMGEAYELCLLGCEFNPALSLHYNALAARQGDPAADMAISKWFLCGYDGVFAKNEALAFHYAERAAMSGLPTAEFALGYFFEIGMYVAQDTSRAKEWYNSAAEHGNKDAITRLHGISQERVLTKQDHEKTAINRIKSQYGSKRGARPERFVQRAPTLPVMYESESVEEAKPPTQLNGRQSIAPYPEDDGHKAHGRVQSLRPIGEPVADRPSSAFGIRPPDLQSHQHTYTSGNMRPSTSMGNIALHNGNLMQDSQGLATKPGSRRLSLDRTSEFTSNGMSSMSILSNGGNQSKLQKRLPSSHTQITSPPPLLQHTTSEPAYTDQFHLQHSSTDPSLNHVQSSKPLPIVQRYPNGGSSQSSGRSVSAAPQSQQTPPRMRPGTSEMRPQSAAQRLPPHIRPLTASTNSTTSNTGRMSSAPAPGRQSVSPERKPVPAARPPVQLTDGPAPSSAPIPAVPRPAGTGPKTFDEMGIPHSKTEGECNLM